MDYTNGFDECVGRLQRRLTGADSAEIDKPISKYDNLYNYVDVFAAWKINFNIFNVTTFTIHNQGSFNFRKNN